MGIWNIAIFKGSEGIRFIFMWCKDDTRVMRSLILCYTVYCSSYRRDCFRRHPRDDGSWKLTIIRPPGLLVAKACNENTIPSPFPE